jgi:hypothetical protein
MSAQQWYETNDDLMREKQAALRLEAAWNCDIVKLSVKYGADWMAWREGEVVGVIEYKNRPHEWNTYSTYMISLHKWISLRVAAEYSATQKNRVTPIIVVEFSDGMYWLEVKPELATLEMGGRIDRDDPEDMEPCMFIPMYHWKKIKEDN